MLKTLDISSSAMIAQRTRLDVIAGNIANSEITVQEDGTVQPYRRRFATFISGDGAGGAGVHVSEVSEDESPPRLVHRPGHPQADARGYVRFPNVNVSMEYVDALEASRAYELNAAMMTVSRGMVQQAIRLFA